MEIKKLSNEQLLQWFEACCNGYEINNVDPLSVQYCKMFKKIESEILNRMKG